MTKQLSLSERIVIEQMIHNDYSFASMIHRHHGKSHMLKMYDLFAVISIVSYVTTRVVKHLLI